MAATQSSSWSDLQPELLGLVLQWLPCLADRVRLAICRTWHYNAQLQHLPPPLPWLPLLDGTFLSFPSSEIHRMPVPDDACYHGSVDNWLFLMHNDGCCSLMNPFSKAMLQLPKLATIWHREMRNVYHGSPLFYKLAVPSFLDVSPDSLVAVLIMDDAFHSALCICLPPIPTDTIRMHNTESIYGMLLLVMRRLGVLLPLSEQNGLQNARTLYFEVFEADLTTDSCCRWRRVSSLAGQALFVGTCSKSLPVAECGLPQEDCIYFTCDYARAFPAPDPPRDSGVFNMRNRRITPLFPETTVVRHVGQGCLTWFFPSEAV